MSEEQVRDWWKAADRYAAAALQALIISSDSTPRADHVAPKAWGYALQMMRWRDGYQAKANNAAAVRPE